MTIKEYFTDDELKCKHCGEMGVDPGARRRLNRVREEWGKPIFLNSAYRCREYNEKMGYTQTHSTGHAFDISCSHKDAYFLIPLLVKHGFTGIGVKQKGFSRFIHADDLDEDLEQGRPRPHIWSY